GKTQAIFLRLEGSRSDLDAECDSGAGAGPGGVRTAPRVRQRGPEDPAKKEASLMGNRPRGPRSAQMPGDTKLSELGEQLGLDWGGRSGGDRTHFRAPRIGVDVGAEP